MDHAGLLFVVPPIAKTSADLLPIFYIWFECGGKEPSIGAKPEAARSGDQGSDSRSSEFPEPMEAGQAGRLPRWHQQE
jgi:hypothetical protein